MRSITVTNMMMGVKIKLQKEDIFNSVLSNSV